MKTLRLTLILFLLFSCNFSMRLKRGNGEIDTKEYRLKSFDKINVGGHYKIKLYRADEPKVFVETDENLFDFLTIEVNGDELYINSEYNLKPTESITIEIYYTELNKIISTGASSIEHKSELKSDDLEISLSGAGSIDLNLDVDELDLNLSGAGLIELEGEVYSQTIQLSGAGALEAQNLKSRYTEIHISGVGNAKVNAKKELIANISGMGNVEYYGDPDEIEQNITGLGRVRKAKDQSRYDEENM